MVYLQIPRFYCKFPSGGMTPKNVYEDAEKIIQTQNSFKFEFFDSERF